MIYLLICWVELSFLNFLWTVIYENFFYAELSFRERVLNRSVGLHSPNCNLLRPGALFEGDDCNGTDIVSYWLSILLV